MNILSYLTRALNFLPEEFSHFLALKGLSITYKCGILKYLVRNKATEGKKDPFNDQNPPYFNKLKSKLGIAAGLDKNGEYIDCLAALGIGFLEVGTVTPRSQTGNKKPRIFRDASNKSILNRLGFNNKGVDFLVNNLKKKKSDIIVGVSIGKNFDTPNSEAKKDYLECMNKVYEFSDYLAINISSPNTQDLRDLSSEDHLRDLLTSLKNLQGELKKLHGYKPLFLKISPDESLSNLSKICNEILRSRLDGIICSNTTAKHEEKFGKGGLSGAPLMSKSTDCLKHVYELVGDEVMLIASGGVMSVGDYNEKISSGAALVQIYTGFIFKGPKLIDEILNSSHH